MNKFCEIPTEIQAKLLPNPTLSIHHLLQYTLPPLSNANLGQGSEAAFFSCSDPEPVGDEALVRLQNLPIPSPKYVNKLVTFCREAVKAGFQSMTYQHLQLEGMNTGNTIYPLWVLTFWQETIRIKDVILKWTRCRDWLTTQLEQRKSGERQMLAQKASTILTLLPWGQNKPRGLADTLPIHGLWRYLGANYLSCSEIEDMLRLIRTDLAGNLGMMMSTAFEGTPFVMFLFEAYDNDTKYCDDRSLAWLRGIGDRLVASSDGRLVTIGSLEPITGEQHWVALLISEGGRRIQYGDSLGREIPLRLREVVKWWIRCHAPALNPSVSNLPTIPQSDGHSCGILAVAALRDALNLPLRTTGCDPTALRLDFFNQVSDQILIRLSQTAIEAGEAGVEVLEFIVEASTVEAITVEASMPESIVEARAPESIVETRAPKSTRAPDALTLVIPNGRGESNSVKRKLTDFWAVETKEEKRLRLLREFERLEERGVEDEKKKNQQVIDKYVQRVMINRETQRRYRERQKQKRVEMGEKGWDFSDSLDSLVPRTSILPPANIPDCTDAAFSHTTVAEISRPRRQFKFESSKDKKPVGRKPGRNQQTAQRTNWLMPLIWSNINQAAVRAGKPWSPRAILREAKRLNPSLFEGLTEQVIGRWIDKGESRWLNSVLEKVRLNSPGGQITRVGILATYPHVQEHISFQLTALREAGVALTLVMIRAIMIAIIEDMAPQIYAVRAQDGSQFKCSESFVRKYLHETLGWSERRATKAAQKLPENLQDVLQAAFLREAFVIRDYSVPAALRVNTDQTQLIYQQGADKTWNLSGVKQVATIGQEEKRAFTLVPSISASGELLPMQAIFMGKTTASCPSSTAPGYDRAQELGFQMLPSMTSTYWSTHETMQTLVDTIIAPYFECKKQELGLPPSQHSIWKIDCWSVHRSERFCQWMKEKHGNIIIIFVPGGCTSVWQPLDVGIQRVLKLSMRRSAHRDIVAEVSDQLENHADHISINTTLGNLRNRSLQWVVNAIDDINNEKLILKAFEMCRVGSDWNLSHQSLTSFSALEALRNLPRTDKKLYEELCGISHATTSQPQPDLEEPPFAECPEDNSDIPVPILIDMLTGRSHDDFLIVDDGSLERNSIAESENMEIGEHSMVQEGRSKRTRKARVPFGGHELWYEH